MIERALIAALIVLAFAGLAKVAESYHPLALVADRLGPIASGCEAEGWSREACNR